MTILRILQVIPVNTELLDNFADITKALTGGTAVMFVAGDTRAMAMQAPGYSTRGIDKPTNENNLRGTKESFMVRVEKIWLLFVADQIENLCIETFQVGKKPKPKSAYIIIKITALKNCMIML